MEKMESYRITGVTREVDAGEVIYVVGLEKEGETYEAHFHEFRDEKGKVFYFPDFWRVVNPGPYYMYVPKDPVFIDANFKNEIRNDVFEWVRGDHLVNGIFRINTENLIKTGLHDDRRITWVINKDHPYGERMLDEIPNCFSTYDVSENGIKRMWETVIIISNKEDLDAVLKNIYSDHKVYFVG